MATAWLATRSARIDIPCLYNPYRSPAGCPRTPDPRLAKAAIKVSENEQDYVTRELLEAQLDDTEEDHACWLEKRLGLIGMMGLQNYIQSRM